MCVRDREWYGTSNGREDREEIEIRKARRAKDTKARRSFLPPPPPKPQAIGEEKKIPGRKISAGFAQDAQHAKQLKSGKLYARSTRRREGHFSPPPRRSPKRSARKKK